MCEVPSSLVYWLLPDSWVETLLSNCEPKLLCRFIAYSKIPRVACPSSGACRRLVIGGEKRLWTGFQITTCIAELRVGLLLWNFWLEWPLRITSDGDDKISLDKKVL